jgi:WXG100 family type VII secretion target
VTGRFRVDPARLWDVVDQLSRFDQHIETLLQDADARVNRLHTTWTGTAVAEHRAAHQRWQRGAQEMREALAVMRGIASTAHENYTKAASTNSRMWAL